MTERPYGLMAEFADPERLVAAVKSLRHMGYRQIDAYTPFPVEGLADALEFRNNRVPPLVLLGGLIGGVGGYFMQWYAAVIDLPINSGGRPLHSWPAFIPATFELAVLAAALTAFFGMLALNGLPRLYHPVFNARDFDLATRNRFFVCVRADDPHFESRRTEVDLQSLAPLRVQPVSP